MISVLVIYSLKQILLTEIGLAVQPWRGAVNGMSCKAARDRIRSIKLSAFCEGIGEHEIQVLRVHPYLDTIHPQALVGDAIE